MSDFNSSINKKALVLGAGGFIGSHMVTFLKENDYWVKGADLKNPSFSNTDADKFLIGDLKNKQFCKDLFLNDNNELIIYDEIYQFAADMGGAGYVHTGTNDADIVHNSTLINLNIVDLAVKNKAKKIFYSSSACVYGVEDCKEEAAYPANPDGEYGWEKLFSERLYLSYKRNHNLDVRIARFHNIFGPNGSWNDGREKAPAAICRKVAMSDGVVEVWGDGKQTRSFLYIDECIQGVKNLMDSDFTGPVNIGSDKMVSINEFTDIVLSISNKKNLKIKHIDGPQGIRGRNSNNELIFKKLNWKPSEPLEIGLKKTYQWILEEVKKENQKGK
jgi:GDP-D-mannose 3', 5'-epimerase